MTVDLWTATLEALAQPDTDAWEVGPIFVPGTPRPQGSKKAFTPKHKKGTPPEIAAKPRRAIIVDDEPVLLKAWRGDVRERFESAMGAAGLAPFEVAVEVAATFTFRRPLHHHVAGDRTRPVKESAPRYHAQAPDIDKLLRSCLDALTGIVWADDKLVVRFHEPTKLWGTREGVEIAARRIR